MGLGLGVRAAITSLFRTYGPTAGAAGVGAGLGLGAGAGGAVSQIGLLPFNAANNMIGSAYFGYGMILGERYMYQHDWPKVQARLEKGESIGAIMHEYTGTFTAMIMDEAKIIFDTLHEGMAQMMADAINNQNSEIEEPTDDVGAQDDGINLTREEIEAFSDARLTLEYNLYAKIGYAEKYNYSTRTLIREIWLIRVGEEEIKEEEEEEIKELRNDFLHEEIKEEEEEEIKELRNDFLHEEIEFLRILTQVTTLEQFWNQYIPSQDDGGTELVALLRANNFGTATTPRNATADSNRLKDGWIQHISGARVTHGANPTAATQKRINELQTLYHFFTLLYSR